VRGSSFTISGIECGRCGSPRTPNKFFEGVREEPGQAHTQQMEKGTQGSRNLIMTVDNTAGDVARAIHSLSDADLVRLKALAQLWTRGLPRGLSWSDVLHEAIARALDGSRKWPAGIPILAFLSGVMRSICEDHWRRERLEHEVLARMWTRRICALRATRQDQPPIQSAWSVPHKAWRPSTDCSRPILAH
jgi:hypothetical protein